MLGFRGGVEGRKGNGDCGFFFWIFSFIIKKEREREGCKWKGSYRLGFIIRSNSRKYEDFN